MAFPGDRPLPPGNKGPFDALGRTPISGTQARPPVLRRPGHLSAPLLSPAEREGSISQHMPDPPEHGCRQPVPNHLCPRCLEESWPVPAKNDHVSSECWPCWELGSFSAEGVGHQGLVAPERRGRHPGTFGIVSFWTVRLRDTSFLSLAQHSRTPVCALLANLPAASGLHGGGATPLNKWGSLHNTGDSNWGPPT